MFRTAPTDETDVAGCVCVKVVVTGGNDECENIPN